MQHCKRTLDTGVTTPSIGDPRAVSVHLLTRLMHQTSRPWTLNNLSPHVPALSLLGLAGQGTVSVEKSHRSSSSPLWHRSSGITGLDQCSCLRKPLKWVGHDCSVKSRLILRQCYCCCILRDRLQHGAKNSSKVSHKRELKEYFFYVLENLLCQEELCIYILALRISSYYS